MANVLDKLLSVLDSQTLNNFIAGKVSPNINVNSKLALEDSTIKTMGLYLFLAFSGSFLLLGIIMYFVIRWALIAAYQHR